MPLVTVKMLEGRTDEQKRNLVEKVTEAVKETTGAAEEKIIVMIEEMRKDHYAVAGKTDQRYGVILDNGRRCYVRPAYFTTFSTRLKKIFFSSSVNASNSSSMSSCRFSIICMAAIFPDSESVIHTVRRSSLFLDLSTNPSFSK